VVYEVNHVLRKPQLELDNRFWIGYTIHIIESNTFRKCNYTKLKEESQMPIVRALRYGQVNLPEEFRKTLNIKEGDLLEAELEGEKIVLTPKTLFNKNEAWEKVFRVLSEVHEKTKHIPIQEAEKDALELIQEARGREYAQKPS